MDDIAYRTFFSYDLTKLPTETLKSVYHTVRIELDKRRQEAAVVGRTMSIAENDKPKVFKGLPRPHTEFNKHWLSYLDELLEQDWSHLFTGDETPKYYVYAHCSPSGKPVRFIHEKVVFRTSGLPFYIGKGTGDRAYDLSRNQGHGEILRGLKNSGVKSGEIVSILKDKLTEAEALELESKLIYFFGTKYEKNRRGLLVNLDIPARPELVKPRTLKSLKTLETIA